MEDGVGGDVLTLGVDGERLQLVSRIRQHDKHSLHPLGVLHQCVDVRQRVRLRLEGGIGFTVGAARLPPLPRFDGVEERHRVLRDRCGVRCGHDAFPSLVEAEQLPAGEQARICAAPRYGAPQDNHDHDRRRNGGACERPPLPANRPPAQSDTATPEPV